MTSIHSILLLSVVLTITTRLARGQTGHAETRETYVHYPASAADLLREEVADIGSPLGLEVVTSLAPSHDENNIWSLLKAIVHRLHNQNQIIHANPHFYVTNGLDGGCRELHYDEDTGIETETEVFPVPAQCEGACTNHGRYCVVEHESFNPAADNHRGAMLVEETLLRMCLVEIYHGSDLKFWEYMEAFDRLQCVKAGDIGECSERAVNLVSDLEYGPLQNCMHSAGGLENDGANVRLKQEVDKRSKGRVPFTFEDVPFIRMGRSIYSGTSYDVPHLFEFVCSVYREETGITPIACDFCEVCSDARECLWKLQCDGKPFDIATFQQITTGGSQLPQTAAPIAVATLQPTLGPAGSPSAAAGETQSPHTDETPMDQTVGTPEQEEIDSELSASDPSYSVNSTASTWGSRPVPLDYSHEDDLSSLTPGISTNEIDTYGEEEDKEEEEYDSHDDHPFLMYAVPVLAALTLLGSFFLVMCLRQKYHEQKVSSAEEYFNDLMDESYRDNLAVSGRIEDEESDRVNEDPPLDAMAGARPPFASFKVHMIMS